METGRGGALLPLSVYGDRNALGLVLHQNGWWIPPQQVLAQASWGPGEETGRLWLDYYSPDGRLIMSDHWVRLPGGRMLYSFSQWALHSGGIVRTSTIQAQELDNPEEILRGAYSRLLPEKSKSERSQVAAAPEIVGSSAGRVFDFGVSVAGFSEDQRVGSGAEQLWMPASAVDLGLCAFAEQVRVRFPVENTGSSSVALALKGTDCGCSVVPGMPSFLSPGETGWIEVEQECYGQGHSLKGLKLAATWGERVQEFELRIGFHCRDTGATGGMYLGRRMRGEEFLVPADALGSGVFVPGELQLEPVPGWEHIPLTARLVEVYAGAGNGRGVMGHVNRNFAHMGRFKMRAALNCAQQQTGPEEFLLSVDIQPRDDQTWPGFDLGVEVDALPRWVEFPVKVLRVLNPEELQGLGFDIGIDGSRVSVSLKAAAESLSAGGVPLQLETERGLVILELWMAQ